MKQNSKLKLNGGILGKKGAGFTLVEASVVMIIAALALLPLINFILSSFGSFNNVKNNAIAANLAQEGLEIIVNLRDEAFLENLNSGLQSNFDKYLASCEGTTCCVDYNTQTNSFEISSCSPNDNSSQLYLNSLNLANANNVKLYTYNSAGAPTLFKRYVALTLIKKGVLFVQSTVTWPNNQINLYEDLYDWQPKIK